LYRKAEKNLLLLKPCDVVDPYADMTDLVRYASYRP
jgi:hypothetical protein